MKSCTLGKRHKWSFVCNQVRTTYSGSCARISKVGIYQCACGQKKVGASPVNEVQS